MIQHYPAALKGHRSSWSWFPENGIWRTLLEIAIIIPAYYLYRYVRMAVEGRTDDAFAHGNALINIEQALGIYREADLQNLILGWDIAVRSVNLIYVWFHLPIVIGVAVSVYMFHRDKYPLYRNALLISGAVALVFFWLLPTAPPRFFQYYGFVDTAVLESGYHVVQSPAFANQYAAMPSLHVGWSTLTAIMVFMVIPGRIRYVAFVLPFLACCAVVLTANHYFIDILAGFAVAGFSLWLALMFRRWTPRRKPFSVLA
jgi:membrane-associated phospholipid phosphatase